MKSPIFVFFLMFLFLTGCQAQTPSAPSPAQTITDTDFLLGNIWDDGQAEVAFYEVTRTRNQYKQDTLQQFLVGTYLVKHDFDQHLMSKAVEASEKPIPAFKYALFYEFDSRSYQYKRNYMVNVARADLAPFKASFTSFDWCSNRYDEMAIHADGMVDVLMRSDDYGNTAHRFAYRPNAYPIHALPLLVRALDFSKNPEQAFSLLQPDGVYVGVRARLDGDETLVLADDTLQAQRIVLTYDQAVRSLVGEEADLRETYWRGVGPDRLLLKLESETGRYRMEWVESLRTPYWQENLWPRLRRVTQRP